MFVRHQYANFRSLYYTPGHFQGSVFVTIYARRFLESMSLPNYQLVHYIFLINFSA